MRIKYLVIWENPINDNNEGNNYPFLAEWVQLSLEQLTLAMN